MQLDAKINLENGSISVNSQIKKGIVVLDEDQNTNSESVLQEDKSSVLNIQPSK